MRRIALLGATGSIGASTLDVVARHPDRFEIEALSAHTQVEALLDLCARFRPRHAVIADPDRYGALRDGLAARGLDTQAAATRADAARPPNRPSQLLPGLMRGASLRLP
jgi:1-deoxy-D-xylulose-5-phosphate reductoisomerase